MPWSPAALFALLLSVASSEDRPTTVPSPSPSSPPPPPYEAAIPLNAFRQQRRRLLTLLADVANASPLLLPEATADGPLCFTVTALHRRQPTPGAVDVQIVLRVPEAIANLTGPILCRSADDQRAKLVRVVEAVRLLGWDTANASATLIRLVREENEDEELNKVRSEGMTGDNHPGLSKTQKFVIYICSAVIGVFFVIAASMRFRNYLQRKASIRKILRCDSPLGVRRLSSFRPSRRGRRLTETRLDTGVIDVDDGEVLKYLSATENERRVQIEDVPTTYQIPNRRRRCSCPHDVACCSSVPPPGPGGRQRSRLLSVQHSTPLSFIPQAAPIAAVSRSSSSSHLPTALPLPQVDLPNASPRRAYQPLALLPATAAAAAMAPAGLLSCRCRMASMGWTCAHRRFYQRMMNPLYDPSLRHEERAKEEKRLERHPSSIRRGAGSSRRSKQRTPVRVDVRDAAEVHPVPETAEAKSNPPERPNTAASV